MADGCRNCPIGGEADGQKGCVSRLLLNHPDSSAKCSETGANFWHGCWVAKLASKERGRGGLTGCKKGCWLALILRGGEHSSKGGVHSRQTEQQMYLALEAVQTFLCPVSPHTRVYSIFDFHWLVDLSDQMSSIGVYRKSPHLVSKAPHRWNNYMIMMPRRILKKKN